MSCLIDVPQGEVIFLFTLVPLLYDCSNRKHVQRWDEFVMSMCPEATFFHRAGWQTVIERAFGHKTWFLFAESDGIIQGVLPLAEIDSVLFGHSLSSLPFCVYGGIAATTESAREVLDSAAQALATQLKVDYLEYRNLKDISFPWPKKDLYVTFRKEMAPEAEENMQAIPRKQRAMVRKGIKAGLESVVDEDVERFFQRMRQVCSRLGTPVFSKKYFQLLKQIFRRNCELMIITKSGRTVSGVMSFYFRDEVLPYYGGGTAEARDVAANDFMYWELMRRLANNDTGSSILAAANGTPVLSISSVTGDLSRNRYTMNTSCTAPKPCPIITP